MQKDKYLKLTNELYKVLDFFPESDPLKNRAKDKALAITEALVLITNISGWTSFQNEKVKVQLHDDIDILLGYLWIAKMQKWINSINYLIIAKEYEKLRNEIGSPINITTKEVPKDLKTEETKTEETKTIIATDITIEITDRQRQILEYLKKNNRAQVMDLQKILPDITKRTIRRDLDELLSAGKIERSGDFNRVFYTIKGLLPGVGQVLAG